MIITKEILHHGLCNTVEFHKAAGTHVVTG